MDSWPFVEAVDTGFFRGRKKETRFQMGPVRVKTDDLWLITTMKRVLRMGNV